MCAADGKFPLIVPSHLAISLGYRFRLFTGATDISSSLHPGLSPGFFLPVALRTMPGMTPPRSAFAAVQVFLEKEGARAPDFSACLILVPHHHAARDVRAALRQALPEPHFLPPRLLTLPEFAATCTVSWQADADSKRLAELHGFLARTGHVPPAGLWQAARELQTLLHEFDMNDADFAVERLSAGRAGNPFLELEAGLTLAVWEAFRSSSPGRLRVYAQRLQHLASQADSNLYCYGLMGLSRVESAFLEAWQCRFPVHLLPDPAPYRERAALLRAVWRETAPDLAERARAFGATCPQPPFPEGPLVHAASSFEEAARVAEHTLLNWLAQGRRQIAVVALDRLLARRLRALLERRQILLQDETGWAFSTSAVSHVLERWLSVAQGRIWHQELLDLCKSPFLFADLQASRAQLVHALETVLRRQRPPPDLAGYAALLEAAGCDEVLPLIRRLQVARAAFHATRLTLVEWSRHLQDSLVILGAQDALSADPVGRQLLELLARLTDEVTDLGWRFSFHDWRRWILLHLEQSTFFDTAVESPIRLTHLAAAHHRDLEGALILGAGGAHLPGGQKSGLFSRAVMRQLGMCDATDRAHDTQNLLMDMLGRSEAVAFVWQSETAGAPAPLSPWLVHLDAFMQAAWATSGICPLPMPAPVPVPLSLRADAAPVLAVPPLRQSVSAWQSLVACPYQYFARHVLGLNEPDEVEEAFDKAGYGRLVHVILAQFHLCHPRLAEQAHAHWQAVLTTLSEAVFADVERGDYQAMAWRLRWMRHVPDYVTWAMAREAEGWRFASAETKLEKSLAWSATGEITLYGRADRLDHRPGGLGEPGERAVLDYKTQARSTLKAKLEAAGEDVQLAAYAWLSGASAAGFVSMDADRVAYLGAAEGEALEQAAQQEAERIAQTMRAMAAGEPLRAHGAPQTCSWCEMQGLCRRAHQHEVS